MYQASVNGIKLHYDRLGHGEPLVLIHGLGERKEGWQCQHSLAEHFDLIIPDLRGFGQTRCSDGQEITIKEFAKDIIELLEQLDINQAHFLGFSMGGMTAQEIYKSYPEKVKSLILANTLFYVPKWLKKFLWWSNRKYINNLTLEDFQIGATLKCLYNQSDEMVQKVMPIWSEHLDGLLPGLNECLEIDYRKTLKQVDVPTLVISCKNDKICPAFNQRRMYKLIPNCLMFTINEAGHEGRIEKTEEFNRVVLKFLTTRTI